MTTTPVPPIVPPDDSDGEQPTQDSAMSDRLAAEGGDPGPEPDLDDNNSSADADERAAMGDEPPTD